MFEQSAFRNKTLAALLVSVLIVSVLIAAPNAAFAQGSAGGSIGNDEKSLSGSRPEPRSVEPEQSTRRGKPQEEAPHRSTSRAGGGVGSFDGAWAVVAIGTTCQGTASGAIVITSGRIIGKGVSGHVSPNGAASAVGNDNGMLVHSSGHFSGRSGSGTYRRADGCMGRWSASKQ